MTIPTSMTLSSLALMLVLGMRHGLDPDHLAAIDGLTLRTASANPRWAPRAGGLFAFGHGIAVMCFAYAASLAPEFIRPSERFFAIVEWIPPILLLLLGLLNTRALLRKAVYRPIGFRSKLLPNCMVESSGPLAAILAGMLFAMVFDTALQAAAWGYAATAVGGTAAAIITGLTFSVGMIATDMLDGWVTSRVLRSGHMDAIAVFRRRLGWPVVLMCFSMAGYGIANQLNPALQMAAAWSSSLGAAMLAAMALVYGYSLHAMRRQ